VQFLAVNPFMRIRSVSTFRTRASQLKFHHFIDRLCRVLKSEDKIKLGETKFVLNMYMPNAVYNT